MRRRPGAWVCVALVVIFAALEAVPVLRRLALVRGGRLRGGLPAGAHAARQPLPARRPDELAVHRRQPARLRLHAAARRVLGAGGAAGSSEPDDPRAAPPARADPGDHRGGHPVWRGGEHRVADAHPLPARPAVRGAADPIFQRDIGFYVFTLPLWRRALEWVFLLVGLHAPGDRLPLLPRPGARADGAGRLSPPGPAPTSSGSARSCSSPRPPTSTWTATSCSTPSAAPSSARCTPTSTRRSPPSDG